MLFCFDILHVLFACDDLLTLSLASLGVVSALFEIAEGSLSVTRKSGILNKFVSG